MSTPPPLKHATVPAPMTSTPVIPLTAEVRTAYQELYDTYEDAIEDTSDPGALEALNASQLDVGNILTKDNMYRLHQDSALFSGLLLQIKSTNADLAKLKVQIEAIASKVSMAGDILAAIGKVLTLVPGV